MSIVAPSYDVIEPGAPPFAERLRIVEALAANTKRVIARLQPLKLSALSEVLSKTLPLLSRTGCSGVTVEGYKSTRGVEQDGEMQKVGGDMVYRLSALRPALESIRDEAHSLGMKFYAAENRLRSMGDDVCCCGVADIPGWRVNRCNLNHLYFGGYEETEKQKERGTGDVFAAITQQPGIDRLVMPTPFIRNMGEIAKSRAAMEMMGYIEPVEQLGMF